MRRRAVQSVLAVMGLGLATAGLIGCPVSSSDDCEALGSCTTTGTSTDTGTTFPAECMDFEIGDVVGESCGLFVDPEAGSDAEGTGTKAKPFATVGAAVQKSGGDGAVYVCAGAEGATVEETGTLVVSGTVLIFGGFACGDWSHTDVKPTILGPSDAVVVDVQPDAGFFARDVAITAQSAKTPGASSIAIFVEEGAGLELLTVDVTAGDGADGVAGETPSGTAKAGGDGQSGAEGCLDMAGVVGGTGGVNQCAHMELSVDTDGGLGGTGTMTSAGGPGGGGLPMGGPGGAGAVGAGTCDDGVQGPKGDVGASGAGATANGSVTKEGFAGASGDAGMPGGFGHGGGGGGGAKSCANGNAGPSGGGGGAGGCGGAPGGGGGAGGSSIGVAAYNLSSVVLAKVKITTGAGGKGGAGGDGQPGGAGGKGGGPFRGVTTACDGGDGGNGGAGGPGGGGRGGHAIGVAYTGPLPAVLDVEFMKGTPGAGGPGGAFNEAAKAGAGEPGIAEDMLELP